MTTYDGRSFVVAGQLDSPDAAGSRIRGLD